MILTFIWRTLLSSSSTFYEKRLRMHSLHRFPSNVCQDPCCCRFSDVVSRITMMMVNGKVRAKARLPVEQHFLRETTQDGFSTSIPFQHLSGPLLLSLLRCGESDNDDGKGKSKGKGYTEIVKVDLGCLFSQRAKTLPKKTKRGSNFFAENSSCLLAQVAKMKPVRKLKSFQPIKKTHQKRSENNTDKPQNKNPPTPWPCASWDPPPQQTPVLT